MTGASSGIGEQFACQLAAKGFNLVATARCEILLQAFALDVGLVISNAGYGVMNGTYWSIELAALEAMYRANSQAPARIAHALLPVMSPAVVAQQALAHLGLQPHFTPGVSNRLLVVSVPVMSIMQRVCRISTAAGDLPGQSLRIS